MLIYLRSASQTQNAGFPIINPFGLRLTEPLPNPTSWVIKQRTSNFSVHLICSYCMCKQVETFITESHRNSDIVFVIKSLPLIFSTCFCTYPCTVLYVHSMRFLPLKAFIESVFLSFFHFCLLLPPEQLYPIHFLSEWWIWLAH